MASESVCRVCCVSCDHHPDGLPRLMVRSSPTVALLRSTGSGLFVILLSVFVCFFALNVSCCVSHVSAVSLCVVCVLPEDRKCMPLALSING